MHSQRDFFYAVLSQSGLPCIASRRVGENQFTHRVFDSIDQLCEAASTLDYTKAEQYFCISTLANKSILVGDKKRVRVQANTLLSRCIVLDIDFKDGHFVDVDSALLVVNEAGSSLGLPAPIAVSSGYGVHVYWPFAEGIPSKDWITLTKQFRTALSIFYPELFADSSRVSDSAGILRIPDSFNLKHEQRVPVTIVQWFDNVVDVGELKKRLSGGETKPTKPSINLIVQTYESRPAEISVVARNCNWLSGYLKNKEVATEPAWYAVLGLAPYLEHTTDKGVASGDKIAQFLSLGHRDYDEAVVTAKYEQAKANQTGPTTCERFRGILAGPCKTCPFAATVKTPIQTAELAKPAVEEKTLDTVVIDEGGNKSVETVTVPLYPKPYFRGENGGVFVRVKRKNEDDGSWDEVIEKVYDYDLYPVRRLRTEVLENEYMEIHVWLPHDGLRSFKLPTSLLAEQKKLAIYLAEKGVISEHGKALMVARYMVDYVRYMQTQGAAEVEFSRFGWRDLHSASPKFVVGNGYIDHKGELQRGSFAHFLKDSAALVATAGTLEGWKEGFEIYKQIPHTDPFILAALMGFAAPLMAMTPYKGAVYNMVGEGGGGKSTALQVMTSVFGQPREETAGMRDTQISVFNTIGYLNSIPVGMDELTNMTGEALSQFTLSFTSGRGKTRADRSGQNKVNETAWETIVVANSNTSLYEKLATNRIGYTAEAMRIFQLDITKPNKAFHPYVQERMKLLRNNYGHAGRIYISYIIQRVPQITELLEKAINSITAKAELQSDERFWGALFGCVLVGGEIARKLGLHTYDVQRLVNQYANRTGAVRENISASQSDPISIFSEFLNTNLDSIIKFTADHKPYMGADGRALSMLRSVKIRMNLTPEMVPYEAWISVQSFRDYCVLKRIQPEYITKELTEMGVFRSPSINKRLASGSGIASGSTSIKCYVVDMTHPKLMEIASDITLLPPGDTP